MTQFTPIVDTSEFLDAYRKIHEDVSRFIAVNGRSRKVTVHLPKPLVTLILKRGDLAYDAVQKKLLTWLSSLGEVGDWTRGKSESGEDYIQFRLTPERLKDEV